MPSATVIRDREGKPIYNYFDGIPVGHIENDKMLIYNHLEITVEVHHTLEKDSRIVGFDVEAFTIEEGPERMNMKNTIARDRSLSLIVIILSIRK